MFKFDLKQRQANTVASVTFWSQFALYSLNSILILYLTHPITKYGLGYSEKQAYAFFGVTSAVGYLMPLLGGFIADKVLGLRRSILLGAILLAIAFLLLMLSGYTTVQHGGFYFILAYALVPPTNSLLMGTSSALVSRIFSDDAVRAKAGMTIFYISINAAAFLAILIAPSLLDNRYGPLSILAIVFAGKLIAALNFAWRYKLYDNVVDFLDKRSMSGKQIIQLCSYLIVTYFAVVVMFFYPTLSSYIISVGCAIGILWFLFTTIQLSANSRIKQLIAVLLIIEAILFFIIYNQMGTTLILFAKNNSNLNFLGLHVSPASYQLVNPIVIIGFGLLLPSFYKKFHQFKIPYQFAAGTILSGLGLLLMWLACRHATNALVNGNYLIVTYFLISVAELWVSAIGLSMIGLYCEHRIIGFAMGAWYLAVSLSNALSGQLAKVVAVPHDGIAPSASLPIYEAYYVKMGLTALIIGFVMLGAAKLIANYLKSKNIQIA